MSDNHKNSNSEAFGGVADTLVDGRLRAQYSEATPVVKMNDFLTDSDVQKDVVMMALRGDKLVLFSDNEDEI